MGSVIETRSLWADSSSRSHPESPVRADVLDRTICGGTGVENVTCRIVFFVQLHRDGRKQLPDPLRQKGPNPGPVSNNKFLRQDFPFRCRSWIEYVEPLKGPIIDAAVIQTTCLPSLRRGPCRPFYCLYGIHRPNGPDRKIHSSFTRRRPNPAPDKPTFVLTHGNETPGSSRRQ